MRYTMSRFSKCLLLLGVLGLMVHAGFAQTFDLQFVVMENDGTNYDVKIQIKANGSTFAMGTSNMIFEFNDAALSSPSVLTAHNFSGGAYQSLNINGTGNARSVNIELNSAGTGTTVSTGYMDVATIRFTTVDPGGNSDLVWNRGASVIFMDDENTIVPAGTLNNLDTSPLPIQLASFTASLPQQSGAVLLMWSTVSEIDNFGFEVQKSQDNTENWQTIENSFVPGNGTTIEPQSYSFTDATATPGVWYYRLKQIDRDGTIHYSESIRPGGVTGVDGRPLPTSFALDQNYPNPFNPATTIEFAVPKETHVTLEVYNLLGQRIAILVDDVRPAGYYAQRFDASALGTGLYFYRLSTGEVSFLKKMLLVK